MILQKKSGWSKTKIGYEYRDKLGQLNNPNGPSVILEGVMYWYKNGKIHRDDGPAIIYLNGDEFYYLNGINVNMIEFNRNKNIVILLGR